MRLNAIRRAIIAALLLPTLALGLLSLFVIDVRHAEYRGTVDDRVRTLLLSELARLAAVFVPAEASATLSVRSTVIDSVMALREQREAVNHTLAAIDELLRDPAIEARVPKPSLETFQAAVDELRAFRLRGDDRGFVNIEVLRAHQPLSLAALSLAETIGDHFHDSTLFRDLRQIFHLLRAHEAALTLSFHGSEYLMGKAWVASAEGEYLASAFLFDAAVSNFRLSADYPPYRTVLTFERSASGLTLAKLRRGIAQWKVAPSDQVRQVWENVQQRRGIAWGEAISQSLSALEATGAALAERSRKQYQLLAALVALSSTLIGILVILAVKGIAVVSQLFEEREQLVSELSNAAQTDLLTGLYNRRGFEVAAAALLRKASGENRTVGLIIFDLDRFKQVNDRHGHDAGDAVLRHVAQVARNRFRAFDLLVRHGGEEFLALLPDSSAAETVEIAERVRAAIESDPVLLPDGGSLSVTASFGCANAIAKVDGDLLTDLIKKADLALYAAKFSGRNKVVLDIEIDPVLSDRRENRAAS